ncbi:uncharacterized protein EDB93DRAFT_307492 [Suillus bovinus]|uniref:uncharacterized protein n=1 Tax=Suillus bovinus TaxID=48563 RepID=UPI001B8872A7|nr:uncharacterized protein EDB93DRAFT_307492 [Suillus bovinus]KAG2151246.1 hypothetical protein EDB93DRAFT_307492 [Suillus bovinus]
MYPLKRLASMWRSDFHLNPVFEETVAVDIVSPYTPALQSMKRGLWWMYANYKLLIRGCDANTKPNHTWPEQILVWPEFFFPPRLFVIDPLQDLAVSVSYGNRQDRCVFSMEFRMASSQRSHPKSACIYFECNHPYDMVRGHHYQFVGRPAICGDRVVVLYYTYDMNLRGPASNIFIQVIDWRKGYAKGYPLYELGGAMASFHLLDEQRIIVIGSEYRMALYTLELDGPLQRRIAYLLPKVQQSLQFTPGPLAPLYTIHTTPSFHGKVVHPDLMPDYVTSLESQIMVLEAWSVILVVDMAIFATKATQSEIPVEIPWSEWGFKYARCFPHHPSHRISVFGSKMAYALPQDHAPEPGQSLEELPAEGYFYVHISGTLIEPLLTRNIRIMSMIAIHQVGSSAGLSSRLGRGSNKAM